ncbi:hypothetical protein BDV18DRAFT_157503 [Aspergillus unguis]
MVYKLDRTVASGAAAAARPEGVAPVFKMKKTRREFRLARQLLEGKDLTLHEEDQGLGSASDAALQCAHDVIHDVTEPEALDENDGDVVGNTGERSNDQVKGLPTCVADSSMLEEDDEDVLVDEGMNKRRSDPPAYVVSHPWRIVDYHLYLCSAEKGHTSEARRDGMYLFDGAECRRLPYDEFAEDRALLSQCAPGDQPQLLFGILPIADRRFADRSPAFGGRHYVLGFDYDCKTLYARHFGWFPHDLSDIWCVWDSSTNVYTVTVPDLIHIMETSLEKGEMHVGMGILSSSQYCLALETDDDPGLEIIIATLWCQWLLDFSEILFKQNTGSLPDFQARLGSYVEQGRLILQRASYRAWFAVRDGYSKEQYKCKTTINQYTNDLYTFEKSEQDGSLKGQSWVAPGLETCNQIRSDERMQRKKRVEQRLQDLFVVPETEETPDPDTVLRELLAKTQRAAEFSAKAPVQLPRTPSPKSPRDSPAHSERCFSPGSPGIVTPATEPYDEFEPVASQNFPLPVLLERSLELVIANPELDTFANRCRVGNVLAEMGIVFEQPVLDSKQSHLLPSPLLD